MSFTVIKKGRADAAYIFDKLKPAFNRLTEKKEEFEAVKRDFLSGRVCLYKFKNGSIDVVFAGRVDGSSYFVDALVGRGLVEFTPHLIEQCKQAGFDSIQFATAKAGMTRILSGFGFEHIKHERGLDFMGVVL